MTDRFAMSALLSVFRTLMVVRMDLTVTPLKRSTSYIVFVVNAAFNPFLSKSEGSGICTACSFGLHSEHRIIDSKVGTMRYFHYTELSLLGAEPSWLFSASVRTGGRDRLAPVDQLDGLYYQKKFLSFYPLALVFPVLHSIFLGLRYRYILV